MVSIGVVEIWIGVILCQAVGQVEQERPVFGTTVVSSSGFRGQIYHLQEGTDLLPRLAKMRSVGSIYTNQLSVKPQQFQRGFPGVTERFEWFGILYTGRIWVEREGTYGFTLESDDGSRLRVNGKTLIDNDGIHSPEKLEASAWLTRGIHEIEVAYFQGPRTYLSLELGVVPPDEAWRVLNTDDFPPPADQTTWAAGKIQKIKSASNQPEIALPNPGPR